MLSRVLSIALSLLIALGACSYNDEGAGDACANDTRKDVYAAGLTKQSSGLSVRIMDATPAPPHKGTNALKLQVLDGNGKGVTGAILRITPFMPDHGHTSAVTPI